MTLKDLGWNSQFDAEFKNFHRKGWQPARLIRDNKVSYSALLGDGTEMEVTMGGAVFHAAETDAALPSVGDWVALEVGSEEDEYEAVIRARLERQTCLSRKAWGKGSEEQVIAANVNVVFVVTDAGQDFNERRLERYFAIMQRSGAQSVAILNKQDLYSKAENQTALEKLQSLNPEIEVVQTTALKRAGVKTLCRYLKRGVTIALIGSSGVGKSSLINQLLGEGEYLWTGKVNELTGKGVHTTTARELILLEEGGMLIDNPGMREVQMWTDAQTLKESFADFDQLAAECQFHDCKHGSDKGCAIQAAMVAGVLSAERFKNYLKLDDELAKLSQRRKQREMIKTRRNRRDKKSKGDKYLKRKHQE